jgi:hypothetical protein
VLRSLDLGPIDSRGGAEARGSDGGKPFDQLEFDSYFVVGVEPFFEKPTRRTRREWLFVDGRIDVIELSH